MRLSILYREPLHSVMDWPSSHIVLIASYLNTEPAPDERLEFSIAQLCSMLSNVNLAKDTEPRKLSDFLLFREVWKPEVKIDSGRYSEADQLMLASLSAIGRKRK